jgi:hypothetical protein
MTAPTAADVAKALRHLADRIEADPTIPPLSPHWPLVFHTLDAVDDAELEAIGRSLGVEDGHVSPAMAEEDGCWHQLRGRVHGVLPVEVKADAGPPLLDPVTDAGVIRRTYVGATL